MLLELESEYQLIQEQCRSTVKMVSKQDQQCTPSSSVVDNEAVNTSISHNVCCTVDETTSCTGGSESSKSDHCSEEQSSSDSDDEASTSYLHTNAHSGGSHSTCLRRHNIITFGEILNIGGINY